VKKSSSPIVIRDLHASILMRLYVLGGRAVPVTQLIEEVRASASADEVHASIAEMAGLLSLDKTGELAVTLEAEGYKQARMLLDIIALTEPSLVAGSTPTSRFLEHFARHKQGLGSSPTGWQIFKQQWKWLFRRSWRPA
jgi:hypothetical protein